MMMMRVCSGSGGAGACTGADGDVSGGGGVVSTAVVVVVIGGVFVGGGS